MSKTLSNSLTKPLLSRSGNLTSLSSQHRTFRTSALCLKDRCRHVRKQALPSFDGHGSRIISGSRSKLLDGPFKAQYSSTATDSELMRTPLYDLHIKHGAKMVPFGGYSMPVQYSDLGVGDSHKWTREKASIFDVSHMVQHYVKGPGAQGFLSKLTPAGLDTLDNHHSILSCLLHPKTGGIVDDTVITRIAPETFYVVTNAGCREKDHAFLQENLKAWRADGNENVEWSVMENQGLFALQGPLAAKVLQPLATDMKEDNLDNLFFGQSKYMKLRMPSGRETSPVLVSRGGYTGEDGFELSVRPEEITPLVEFLLTTAGLEQLRLAGLGARDSLRLEAGMCLYGHDLDDSITPVEAGLTWVIAKDRRTRADFNGAEEILRQIKPKKEGGTGTSRRRVGLIVEAAPAREGAEIMDEAGNVVGKVTSGCPSPTLGKNIAMGYVKTSYSKTDTELQVVVRGKKRRATVTKMPFVPSKYWKERV